MTAIINWKEYFSAIKKNHMPKRRKSHLKISANYLPARVLLFRHAEKPTDDKKNPDLSERGYSRAAAIPPFYYSVFKTADIIYAATSDVKSKRPYETALPLATAFNLTINDHYANKEYDSLASDMFDDPKVQGKTVVIFWHHGKLDKLLQALGGPKVDKWSNSVYDRVWSLTYGSGNVLFEDLPQRLLFGDSAH